MHVLRSLERAGLRAFVFHHRGGDRHACFHGDPCMARGILPALGPHSRSPPPTGATLHDRSLRRAKTELSARGKAALVWLPPCKRDARSGAAPHGACPAPPAFDEGGQPRACSSRFPNALSSLLGAGTRRWKRPVARKALQAEDDPLLREHLGTPLRGAARPLPFPKIPRQTERRAEPCPTSL